MDVISSILADPAITALLGVFVGYLLNSRVQGKADQRADERQEKANTAAREIALAATREAARIEDLKHRVAAAKVVGKSLTNILSHVKSAHSSKSQISRKCVLDELKEVQVRVNEIPTECIFKAVEFIHQTNQLLDKGKSKIRNDTEFVTYIKQLEEFEFQLMATQLVTQQQWNKPPSNS